VCARECASVHVVALDQEQTEKNSAANALNVRSRLSPAMSKTWPYLAVQQGTTWAQDAVDSASIVPAKPLSGAMGYGDLGWS